MNLTTDLCIVMRLKISEAITLLPLHACICLHGVGQDNFAFLIFTKVGDLNQIHCIDTTHNLKSLHHLML
jgi:hypothetical protein